MKIEKHGIILNVEKFDECVAFYKDLFKFTVDETAEEVRARGRRSMAVGLDVRDESAVATLAQTVLEGRRYF